VHGTDDEVIPFRHGEQLAAAAPAGTPFVRVDGARHMESLSRADVQRVAREHLTPERLITVVVGNQQKINLP